LDSFESAMQWALDEGHARAEAIGKQRGRIVLFLLGPGHPPGDLALRRWVRDELGKLNIRGVVMEDVPEASSNLAGKFEGIVKRFKPDLIVAIFTRAGRIVGVTFELGLLTGMLGFDKMVEKARYCVHAEMDEDKLMTAYVKEQLLVGRNLRFSSKRGLLQNVVRFVDNYIIQSGGVPSPSW